MNKLLPLLFILLFTACSPKKFYTLGDDMNIIPTKNKNTEAIAIAKISVPKYLKEHRIVRQVSSYEIKLIDKAQWLIPMEKNLTELLISYLQQSMNNPNIHLYPWDSNNKTTKLVTVKIQKFIASNTQVTLKANYKISNLITKEHKLKSFISHINCNTDIESMLISMEKSYLKLLKEIESELLLENLNLK